MKTVEHGGEDVERFRRLVDDAKVVIVQLWNSQSYYDFLLAAWGCETTVVHISPLASETELGRVIDTVAPDLLIRDTDNPSARPDVDTVGVVGSSIAVRFRAGSRSTVEAFPRGNWVLCSSGTTGQPSLHAFSREALRRNALNYGLAIDIERYQILTTLTPWSHAFGLLSLIAGRVHNLQLRYSPISLRSMAATPSRLFLGAEETVVTAVPSALRLIASQQPAALRYVSVASSGEALTPDLTATLNRIGTTRIYDVFGLTERLIVAVRAAAAGEEMVALPGVRFRNNEGRLEVASVEYPEWFDTGDLVAHSPIEFRGRRARQFLSGGRIIDPQEIELCLLSEEGVTAACVLPQRDGVLGQAPAALIATECPGEPLMGRTRTRIQGELARYKWPVLYKMVDKLPLLPNGKLDLVSCSRELA